MISNMICLIQLALADFQWPRSNATYLCLKKLAAAETFDTCRNQLTYAVHLHYVQTEPSYFPSDPTLSALEWSAELQWSMSTVWNSRRNQVEICRFGSIKGVFWNAVAQ